MAENTTVCVYRAAAPPARTPAGAVRLPGAPSAFMACRRPRSYRQTMMRKWILSWGIATLALAAVTFALAWLAWQHRPAVVPATVSNEVVSRVGLSRRPRWHRGPRGRTCRADPERWRRTGTECSRRAEAKGAGNIRGVARTVHRLEGLSAGQTNAGVFEPEAEGVKTELEVGVSAVVHPRQARWRGSVAVANPKPPASGSSRSCMENR